MPEGVNSECRRCYGLDEERSVKIAEMKGIRFSLWSMFLGVAAAAIVCAALVKPTESWAMAFQAAALGVLTFALLAALAYERGAARAFWIGFAVVGWGHLSLHRLQISEISLTREISERLKDAIHPLPPPSAAPPLIDPAASQPMSARAVFPYLVFWFWPLLLGFVGGTVAQQMYARRERLAARAKPSGSGSIA